jgi:hypothetical protein
MSDDLERRLGRLTIRGVRPEVRAQVLAAVESELQRGGSATAAPTAVARKGTEEVVGKTLDSTELRLRQPPPSPWLRRAAAATAAGLLLGVGLNLWVTKESQRRFAQLFGPPPVSKRAMEIAKDVEAITDAETGQWVYRQFTVLRRRGDDAAAYARYCDTVKQLIDELQTVSKDTYHEAIQEDPEMDRGHTRCVGGSAAYCQCRDHLEDRCTA